MRLILALFFVIVFAVVGIDGLTQIEAQTTSLKTIADTPTVVPLPGLRGLPGKTGASAFPYRVRVAGRSCTVTNLWREGTLATYENRRLTYPAARAPFFCGA